MKRLALILWILGVTGAWAEYPWQAPHARVLPQGGLEWAPEPFVFEKGDSVRYIDFAKGGDQRLGTSPAEAWKHHPWDPAAKGRAKACSGIHTYVFKRGVDYRGSLIVAESGAPGNPIRLTSDPAWGKGAATISGSERVTGWQSLLDHPDIPKAERVYYADLDFAPRNVWLVADDGAVTRIPLARTPNWKVSDPDDVKSEWWQFDNPRRAWGERLKVGKAEAHLGTDTQHLRESFEYYKGAYVWSEYGWVMGTPYPSRVQQFVAQRNALAFGGQWGSSAGSYHVPRYTRYYLEDKPHYLDEPGEFWFEKKGKGGRLHLRLPEDSDPNKCRVEAARRLNLIDADKMSHMQISGLTFRFTNTYWNLDAPPFRHKDVSPACIRLLGSGEDIVVANCSFEHVHLPVRMKAVGDDDVIDRVAIRDNEIKYTDHGAIALADGGAWGKEYPRGRLYHVRVMRNRLFQIGRRPTRYGQGHAIDLDCPETAEIAGNVLDRLYGAGIFVFGGKRSAAKADRPLTRILIHHNKVTDSMLNNNDWGGIETWQGGPAYVWGNISGNPGGYKLYGLKISPKKPAVARFGHAYYMDGGFKQYYFNNIAWGKSKDPFDPLGNCAAFQEIHGYLASVFNNTVYNFVIGSRRQAPVAGRNKYLGNIWHSIGHMVFRHAKPGKAMADANAADAGPDKSTFHHESNAYARNVFYDVPKEFAVFEPSGRRHESLESFRAALAARRSLGGVGEIVAKPPLAAPGQHDFRPTDAARDRGVKVFVPWGLYATVGEWGFYAAGDDPTRLMDEHFHLAPSYVDRQDYHKQPMYPLRAVNLGEKDYVAGPLEDWTRGALRFNGRNQYALLAPETLRATPEFEVFEVTNKEHDWIAFETPEEAVPGQPLEVKVRLKRPVKPGLKLKADLHWMQTSGRFGGVNVSGGAPQSITGEGPYVFRITPKSKQNLRNFIFTAWLTPTGGWKDRTKMAQHAIAKGQWAPAGGRRSPLVHDTNFLIEAYFRAEPGRAGGTLVRHLAEAGYRLEVNPRGGVTFAVQGLGAKAGLTSQAKVADGQWHHVIAEADRAAKTLALYIDGKADANGPGVGADVSLASDAPLYVAGAPEGQCLAGAFEFLRLAHGTLKDAKTTIEELYAWQFGGPHLRDFCGRQPTGKRDAGALEHVR